MEPTVLLININESRITWEGADISHFPNVILFWNLIPLFSCSTRSWQYKTLPSTERSHKLKQFLTVTLGLMLLSLYIFKGTKYPSMANRRTVESVKKRADTLYITNIRHVYFGQQDKAMGSWRWEVMKIKTLLVSPGNTFISYPVCHQSSSNKVHALLYNMFSMEKIHEAITFPTTTWLAKQISPIQLF